MLVLTRRTGETIIINGNIRVTVLLVKGDKVRLGVSAPASVRVDRSEVHERRQASGAGHFPFHPHPQEHFTMPTAQPGDRVQVHYVLRLQDGSVASSRGGAPLELTVGTDHPRLPGLGLALVGLTPGEGTTLTVPPEEAYGLSNPSRVHRCSRRRFPEHASLQPGRRVSVQDKRGRRRLVRILQVGSNVVVVDANHRWAGQTLEMEVKLVAIQGAPAGSEVTTPAPGQEQQGAGHPAPESRSGEQRLPRRARAVAFDVDAVSLAGLQEALPGWEINCVHGASAASLAPAWEPGAADLLVVGPRAKATDTVGLCRFLAFCTSYSGDSRQEQAEGPGPGLPNPPRRVNAPLLVLVLPGQETLVGAVLEAGAHSCLVLPLHPEEVTRMLAHAQAGNQSGRHTLNLERPQGEDLWRDDGGEG